MIDETIRNIEVRLAETGSLTPDQRAELVALVQNLKVEIAELVKSDPDRARHLTQLVDRTTAQAIHGPSPELNDSAEGLAANVADFETAHPKLVQVVNRIATTLSNMGI